MKNKKDILLTVIMLLLAAVVIVSTLVYLLTDKMIPGLQPFAQAALMVPMILVWKRTQNNQWISFLFVIAAVLNVIAGIMQIVSAI